MIRSAEVCLFRIVQQKVLRVLIATSTSEELFCGLSSSFHDGSLLSRFVPISQIFSILAAYSVPREVSFSPCLIPKALAVF